MKRNDMVERKEDETKRKGFLKRGAHWGRRQGAAASMGPGKKTERGVKESYQPCQKMIVVTKEGVIMGPFDEKFVYIITLFKVREFKDNFVFKTVIPNGKWVRNTRSAVEIINNIF